MDKGMGVVSGGGVDISSLLTYVFYVNIYQVKFLLFGDFSKIQQ